MVNISSPGAQPDPDAVFPSTSQIQPLITFQGFLIKGLFVEADQYREEFADYPRTQRQMAILAEVVVEEKSL